MPSICQGTWDCQICPKAVSNAITHVIYQRGFHKPAQKCEENLILFLMKGEILVNSKEVSLTSTAAWAFGKKILYKLTLPIGAQEVGITATVTGWDAEDPVTPTVD